MNQRLFQSESVKIGKTFWRIAVEHFDYLKANCTLYEWSKDGMQWHNYKEWDNYSFNGSWGPKGLANLYSRNLPAFSEMLGQS